MAYLKPIPVALVPALPSELLVYLLSNTNVFHTTVIICQSRESKSYYSLIHLLDWIDRAIYSQADITVAFVSSLVKSLQETDAKTTSKLQYLS